MAHKSPSDWCETTMREVITFFASGDPFLKLEYSASGVPVLAKGDVKPFGRVEHGEKRYISHSLVEDRGFRTTKPGDYLLTTRDLTQLAEFLGLIAPIPTDQSYLVNQGANVVRFCSKVNGRYIVYWCNGPIYRAYIKGHYVGSTQIHIRKEDFFDAPLWLPEVEEQNAIANVLGTLDDKIELNRCMNETLENMARVLFKSWFVDFEPVFAKSQGRETGLPKELADLFPDSFEDSTIGEVPKGWRVGTLADVAALNPESWSKETRPEFIEYVDLSNTKWGHIEVVTKYTQSGAPSRAQRVLRPKDTIVGTVRPGNGSYALVTDNGLTGSTGFAVLRPKKEFFAELVYLAATSTENIETLAHLADGGAYPAVRPEVVASTAIVLPSEKIVKAFSNITSSILAKMGQNDRENKTLATQRDGLLPKLISGEVRVMDAERFIREAGL